MRTFLIIALCCIAAGCVAAPPSEEEWAFARAALKPHSDEAAQKAVVDYFGTRLKDPESARFKFLPLWNGVAVLFTSRQTGWFMCGTVNAKNSYGGYTGAKAFLVHFKTWGDTPVEDGTIDSPGEHIVADWCRSLYGS